MKKNFWQAFPVVCAAALLVSLTSFRNAGAERAAPVPEIAFEKFTLSNGLQVILHVDRRLPLVHINQWFHVGSKNEEPRRTGFAHLFEHMMFQGSKHAPSDYFSYVSGAGANLFAGGVNGTTDEDRTNYFVTAPSASLEYLLWLESDRLATLPEALTQEKLDNQREVVKNERRQSFENQPYGLAYKLIGENVHPVGHPYSWPVFGSHEDLTAATLDDVREFFGKYYTPNNLSLAITGDFDPAEAKRLVEKYFGGIAPGPALERPKRWIPKLDGEKVVEATDRVPQARLYLAWPSPAYFEAGDADLQIAAAVLSDGLSARLTKALVYDRQIASDVAAFQGSSELSGLFVIRATARGDATLEQIEQLVTAEVARLAKEGPTPRELERIKTKIEYGFVSALENIGGFGGKADRLNQYNTLLGDPGKLAADLARYRTASAASVRDSVQRWVDTRNRLQVRYRSEPAGRPASIVVDRSRTPPIVDERTFTAPEVKAATLENGLEVLVVERRDLPKVVAVLTTRAGGVADPPGKAGLANLTAATIDLGTQTRSALQIEEAMGQLGSALSSNASREFAQASLEILARNLGPGLAILSDAVRHPTFPESEIAREKKLLTDRFAQEASNPAALAAKLGDMLMFGREHPYGRPLRGTQETLAAITRADLERMHETRWRPASSALILVGDVSLAEATRLANEHFGSWTGGPAALVDIPRPQPFKPGGVFLVDRQDAPQTQIAQLLPAPPRSTPDYYPLMLVNTVWASGFESRLMKNLREEKGYSYGIYSFPSLYTQAGVWGPTGGVQTNKTAESIAELIKELADVAGTKPITEAELVGAKTNRVRGYAQEFSFMGRIAGQVAQLWALGLPMTELQRFATENSSATLTAVNTAARNHIDPREATILMVGDQAKIEPALSKLKLGVITVLDTQGNVVRR